MKKELAALTMCIWLTGCAAPMPEYVQTDFVMSTVMTQRVWASNAQSICAEIQKEMQEMENRLSLYRSSSEIVQINRMSGQEPVYVSRETADLLREAMALNASVQALGSSTPVFSLTLAPVTLAWGVYTEHPRVPSEQERTALLGLIDDDALHISEDNRVQLEKAGQGIDLGGIAKGAACDQARVLYEKHGVRSALLDLGGNLMALGTKPNAEPFRVGFRDPQSEKSAMASFVLQNEVVAVSGGYERFFEADGKRYIHIFDPVTAAPVESDLLAVGVIAERGIEADFYSTALYTGGLQLAVAYMRAGGTALAVTHDQRLYVSERLKESFRFENGKEGEYQLQWVASDADHRK